MTFLAAAQRPKGRGVTRAAGLAAMGAGLVGTLVAQVDLGRSWRIGVDPVERTELVTAGMFSLVRNPIFAAMATFGIGTALAQRTLMAALAAISTVAAVGAQVRLVEEPYLLKMHGDDYMRYCEQVGRFVPELR